MGLKAPAAASEGAGRPRIPVARLKRAGDLGVQTTGFTHEKCFFVVEPSKIIFVYKILYPKRRIESYSITGTLVSPNKILLT